MLARLFLLFTITTTVELFLLLEMSQRMGVRATLLLILITGITGAWLSKREGLRTLARVRSELAQGKVPGDALVDGLCILIAGAFLLTPGLLTDASGFLLLMPWFRRPIKAALRSRFEAVKQEGMAAGRVHFINMATGGGGSSTSAGFASASFGGAPRGSRGPVVDVTPPRSPEQVSARTSPLRPKAERTFASGDIIDVSDD